VAADLPLTCLPGPSAVTTALAVSGLPADRFCFEGFAPRKQAARRGWLAALDREPRTCVFFESPRRLAECLTRWRELVPDIPVELTEMRPAELLAALRSEEMDAGFSFGLPDSEAIAQHVAWMSPIVALLPRAHELACREVVSLAELSSFPAIACSASYHPGLCQQMKAVRRRYSVAPTIVGEARTLTGYLTRVAAGQGVGVADADHMRALRRTDVVVVPLAEPVHFTTYVLHKHRRNGLPESLQRFLTHATALN